MKAMAEFDPELAETVLSNSVAHHLPDPGGLLVTAKRLTSAGGRVFIRDLIRPEDEPQVEAIVEQHAGSEPEVAQQLLRQSLHAALTLEEAKSAATEAGIPAEALTQTSDRHWTLDWSKP